MLLGSLWVTILIVIINVVFVGLPLSVFCVWASLVASHIRRRIRLIMISHISCPRWYRGYNKSALLAEILFANRWRLFLLFICGFIELSPCSLFIQRWSCGGPRFSHCRLCFLLIAIIVLGNSHSLYHALNIVKSRLGVATFWEYTVTTIQFIFLLLFSLSILLLFWIFWLLRPWLLRHLNKQTDFVLNWANESVNKFEFV